MTNNNNLLYELAIERWGKALQLIMVIEEMSELTKEISKEIRGKGHSENIFEEIADVEIMLEQLKVMFGNEKAVEEWNEHKLNKLADMLNIKRKKDNGK